MHDQLIAIILGIVEGLTEFVPVSSTGHLIVAGHLLGFTGDRADTFEVFIQLGAILAVTLIFRERIMSILRFGPGEGAQGKSGFILVAITTIPGLIAGALLNSPIKDHLFSPGTVAVGWAIGGILIILVERNLPPVRKGGLDKIRWRDALIIGICQCAALWPGVSRSASTMSAGMLLGIDRKTAAEYSFLAALPLIAAASFFDLVSNRNAIHASDIPMFATGFIVSFIVGWFAVRYFLRLLSTWTLVPFGWYRIAATVVLVFLIAINQV
ncbi:MAG TPA: undecaprenyl-diphosphate phosphatase [Thermomicrobiales bacterium]|nr:undecaprenyl-diphosphate phosphatase [Thermomicrobiales bacterium]